MAYAYLRIVHVARGFLMFHFFARESSTILSDKTKKIEIGFTMILLVKRNTYLDAKDSVVLV